MAIERTVLTSLHGRRFGLSKDGNIVGANPVTGGESLISLAHANTADRVEFYDDFLGKAIGATWGVQKGSDGGTVNFAFLAGTSGLVRATTGADAAGTMATNGVQLDHALNWTAANGGLVFETSLKLSAITNVAVFAGFTNQVSSLQMPATLSVATFTGNAADCVGFLFDTSATTVTIRCVGYKATVAATPIDTSIAFVAATLLRLKVGVDANGTATFFINGAQVGAPMANAITVATALTPSITAASRAAATRTVDVDFIRVGHDR